MKELYTILFDPHSTGDFRLYDRNFHVVPDSLRDQVDKLNSISVFPRYKLVKVIFEDYA